MKTLNEVLIIEEISKVLRVAIYIRVSTYEQASNGLSLENQKETMRKYCELHNYKIIDYYCDAGVTAAKKLSNRKEFMRMMQDIDDNKIDLVLVLRLDRFFRNIYDYHDMMRKHFEPHNVGWKAINEEYDTTTVNGRLMINVRLSIAEAECEIDSLRINDIVRHQVENGKALTGAVNMPIGFTVEDKKVVKNEDNKHIAEFIIRTFQSVCSIKRTQTLTNNTFGLQIRYITIKKLLSNSMICGEYKGNENYCEGYITREEFDVIQSNLGKNVREIKNRKNYIFSSLLVCSHCGKRLVGYYGGSAKPTKCYRCNNHRKEGRCDNNKTFSENRIEAKILNAVFKEIDKQIFTARALKVERQGQPVKSNKSLIKTKQKRLNDLYINGVIEFDEYKKQYDDLESQIIIPTDRESELVSLEHINNILKNLYNFYGSFTEEEKCTFWRGIIEKVEIDGHNIKSITFLT